MKIGKLGLKYLDSLILFMTFFLRNLSCFGLFDVPLDQANIAFNACFFIRQVDGVRPPVLQPSLQVLINHLFYLLSRVSRWALSFDLLKLGQLSLKLCET